MIWNIRFHFQVHFNGIISWPVVRSSITRLNVLLKAPVWRCLCFETTRRLTGILADTADAEFTGPLNEPRRCCVRPLTTSRLVWGLREFFQHIQLSWPWLGPKSLSNYDLHITIFSNYLHPSVYVGQLGEVSPMTMNFVHDEFKYSFHESQNLFLLWHLSHTSSERCFREEGFSQLRFQGNHLGYVL